MLGEGLKQKSGTLTIAVVALAVGFGGAAAARSLTSDSIPQQTRALSPHPRSVTPAAQPRLEADPSAAAPILAEPEAPDAPAASPVAAVEQFLAAEQDGDWDTSFGLLSDADRAITPSRARWAAAHGDREEITGFEIGAVRPGLTSTEVDVVLHFHSQLDEVVGLVPATADSTWLAVAEEGGWRVRHAGTALHPRYPDTADASVAVREWIRDKKGCREAASSAHLGRPELLDALCSSDGRADVGNVTPLAPSSSSDPFLAAYGPEVFDWAQAVPVRSPVAVRVVVAPIGDEWRVIGAVEF